MSNYAPGWYPDGSGRFAQRYYDGNGWTEHVLDTQGNRGTDPVGGGAPTQYTSGNQQQQPPRQQPQQYGQQTYAQPPAPPQQQSGQQPASSGRSPHGQTGSAKGSTGPFTLTLGTITAGVGGILVLLSVLVLGFLGSDGQNATLGDISEVPGEATGFLLDSYAGFGRYLAILVVAWGIVAVLRLRAMATFTQLPLVTAIICGIFALWHLLAMFVTGDVDASPTFDSLLGLLGYVGLGVGTFLTQPVGTRTEQ